MDISTIKIQRRHAVDRFKSLRSVWYQHAVQRMKPLDVATNQSAFLRALRRLGPCTLSDIAAHTHIDPAAVVRVADSLVGRGWIQRVEHPTDRRCWRVTLSSSGRAMATKLEKVYDRIVQELLSPLDPKTLNQFIQILDALLKPHETALKTSVEPTSKRKRS